jgi:hypothetical protein
LERKIEMRAQHVRLAPETNRALKVGHYESSCD